MRGSYRLMIERIFKLSCSTACSTGSKDCPIPSTRSREFMRRLILLTAAWLILGSTGSLFAQGVQTGTIRGEVKDQQDLAVPGVTVTVTSPALQGPRSTVTDKDGIFAIRALPPGDYQVKFELNGFATLTRNATVPLGLVVE